MPAFIWTLGLAAGAIVGALALMGLLDVMEMVR